MRTVQEALDVFIAHNGGKEGRFIAALWDNWPMVLGDELARMALPLGHKDHTLLIGAEDSMAMQDVTMHAQDILDRVNAFMHQPYFERVRVSLLLGKKPLTRKTPPRPAHRVRPANPPRPAALGSLLLPQDSLVAECYLSYLRAFE